MPLQIPLKYSRLRFQAIHLAHFDRAFSFDLPFVILVRLRLFRYVHEQIEYLACVECQFYIPYNSCHFLISYSSAATLQAVLSGHLNGCSKPSKFYAEINYLTGVFFHLTILLLIVLLFLHVNILGCFGRILKLF